MRPNIVSLFVASLALTASPLTAAAVTVSPTSIEVVASENAASRVVLRNDADTTSDVQVRVMRWTQVNGEDRLERTEAVVVSPPISRLAPGAQQTVRIVRQSATPIVGEEAFRVLVDQLPRGASQSGSNVALLVRQSVPVFFRSQSATSAPLRFGTTDGSNVVAQNPGQTFHRVLSLTAEDAQGRTTIARSGLVGYVLGGSQFAWRGAGASSVSGHTHRGAFEARIAR